MINKKLSFMQIALNEAKNAELKKEVPIGAVIIDKLNNIIARSGNKTIINNDPTAHAEILVIRYACDILKVNRLNGCKMYVTLEPCNMCATAISFARIEKLYYAAESIKFGAINNGTRFYNNKICYYAPQVVKGLNKDEASKILINFFKNKR